MKRGTYAFRALSGYSSGILSVVIAADLGESSFREQPLSLDGLFELVARPLRFALALEERQFLQALPQLRGNGDFEPLAFGDLAERMPVFAAGHGLRGLSGARMTRRGAGATIPALLRPGNQVGVTDRSIRLAVRVVPRRPYGLGGHAYELGDDALRLGPRPAQRRLQGAFGVPVQAGKAYQAGAPLVEGRNDVGRIPVRRGGWFFWRNDCCYDGMHEPEACGKNFRESRKIIPDTRARIRSRGTEGVVYTTKHGVEERTAPIAAAAGVKHKPGSSFRMRLTGLVEFAGSRAELARRSGLNEKTIRNYLSGTTEPKARVVGAIAAAMNVREEWLFSGALPMLASELIEAAVEEESPGYMGIDVDLMIRVIAGVEATIPAATTQRRATLIAFAYEHMVAINSVDQAALDNYLRRATVLVGTNEEEPGRAIEMPLVDWVPEQQAPSADERGKARSRGLDVDSSEEEPKRREK